MANMTLAIVVIVCCWIVSFFFNGIESGLLSIDPVRLRQNVKRGVPAALRLNRLLKQPERLLATVLLVTNAADIIALVLLTSQLVRWHRHAGFLFALVIALPVYLFVLSVLPKSLFRRFPFRALVRLAGVLELTSILFSPLLELGARIGKLLLPGHAGKRGRLFAARRRQPRLQGFGLSTVGRGAHAGACRQDPEPGHGGQEAQPPGDRLRLGFEQEWLP